MIELSSELLRLRKFLIMLLDTHASVILYLGSEKVSGVHFAEIEFLIEVLQASVLKAIYAMPRENAARISWMASRRHACTNRECGFRDCACTRVTAGASVSGIPRSARDKRAGAGYGRPIGVSRSNRDVPLDDPLRPCGAGL